MFRRFYFTCDIGASRGTGKQQCRRGSKRGTDTRKTLADESVKRFGQDVLDNMVNRQLIMQECVNRGVEVTNQEVSDEIRRLAAKFGLSLESYLQLLRKSVISRLSVQS